MSKNSATISHLLTHRKWIRIASRCWKERKHREYGRIWNDYGACLRVGVAGHRRFFGWPLEVVVADRELVVVFRSGGYSVFKLKLMYNPNYWIDTACFYLYLSLLQVDANIPIGDTGVPPSITFARP